MTYFIAYDITDHKIRYKVATMLENIGNRVQYSVFQCSLTPHEIEKLISELKTIVNKKHDSIHIYPICDACLKLKTELGNKRLSDNKDYRIL